MEKLKHTKGEWVVKSSKETNNLYSMIYSEDVRIAEVKSYGNDNCFNDATYTEKEANAKLIAAAPDLLEALIEAKERYCTNPYESLTIEAKIIYDKINNAINKATI